MDVTNNLVGFQCVAKIVDKNVVCRVVLAGCMQTRMHTLVRLTIGRCVYVVRERARRENIQKMAKIIVYNNHHVVMSIYLLVIIVTNSS